MRSRAHRTRRSSQQGIAYYTAATLDQEVARYNELKARVTESLPARDPNAHIGDQDDHGKRLLTYQAATAALEQSSHPRSRWHPQSWVLRPRRGFARWRRRTERWWPRLAERGPRRSSRRSLDARRPSPDEPTEPTPTPGHAVLKLSSVRSSCPHQPLIRHRVQSSGTLCRRVIKAILGLRIAISRSDRVDPELRIDMLNCDHCDPGGQDRDVDELIHPCRGWRSVC